ncbi:hypothetical protein RMSM_01080 [Rhodopirellula maiorica SM1]|uniref:Phage baseplate protein n=2 Tax=Novipirellula TaxID=2795426 RepID=M5RRN3_9BACT|nr:hypothetical protein RMSM_01080 [Rhodopirellula maiorica SM1]
MEQAIVMLATAIPQLSTKQIVEMPIGRRDGMLLDLRKRLFGNRIELLGDCPECSEVVELDFEVDDILLESATPQDVYITEVDGLEIAFCLPTTKNLVAVTNVAPDKRADEIITACVTRVGENEHWQGEVSLTASMQQRITAAMAEQDPQADVQLELECVACQHRWTSPFDIVSLLWSELNAWCQRLLGEIHTLAKAYGWTEHEILSLGRWRRQVYLNMVRQ